MKFPNHLRFIEAEQFYDITDLMLVINYVYDAWELMIKILKKMNDIIDNILCRTISFRIHRKKDGN